MTHRTHHSHSHSSHSRSHSHSHSHSRSHSHSQAQAQAPAASANNRGNTFNKVFRWHPKAGQPMPDKVEVVGSFTNWYPMALHHDRFSKAWQLSLHDIPGNCTHHYMLLVDGQPANDPHSDGLTAPGTANEERYQYQTARGPRIFILLSQTK